MMIRNRNYFNLTKHIIRRSSTAQPIINNTSSPPPPPVQESKFQQLINADIKEGNPVPIFKSAVLNNSRIAVKDLNGEKLYSDLVAGSFKLSKQIGDVCEKQSLSRVAFLCQNDVSYIISQWATWMSGQIAVPLSVNHPPELLEYFISNSEANLILTTPEFEERLKPVAEKLKKPLQVIEAQSLIQNEQPVDEDTLISHFPNGSFYKQSPALIMYTSGTTSKPKGVIMSYSNLDAQIATLQNAWNIQNTDIILHSLPLHHVHGVINALLLPLTAGGKVIMLPKFDSDNVWTYLLNVNLPQKDRVTCYMGVPTSYHYLIQEYDKLFSKSSQMTEYIKTHCQNKIRLMISGSAPLPQTTFQRWKEITGHKLLERYGMSEIGMCLSNSLKEDKDKQRLPGFVGHPLPGVEIRITSADNEKEILLEAKGEYNKGYWSKEGVDEKATIKIKPGSVSDAEIIGGLQVRGPNVFKEYYKRPEATKSSFTDDGWFITGDTVCYDPTVNSFKIMGRNSVDIIKSRGYKVSALEIETKLLENSSIDDCAVLGVPDEVLGQQIIALIVFKPAVESQQTEELIPSLKKWCESKFASYSMPSVKIVSKIPRNQMGKVNKADLVKDIVKAMQAATTTAQAPVK